jgi:cyclohexa-1,5-dienecarbonyl-CoA hydratase
MGIVPKAENSTLQRKGPVARLVINRPPLNILDIRTIRELRAQLNAALSDDSTRLVEVRGEGEKAFSAGADIQDHLPDRVNAMLTEFHALIRAVLDSGLPTIATVRGHCLGGGMELAMSCDFIVACDDARFGQPEIKVGAFPPVAAALLPKIIGGKRALEMILTGEVISAAKACEWGLVNCVAPSADLDREIEALENSLLAQSPVVLALARRATRVGPRAAFEAELREIERIYLEELIKTRDSQEGLRAFMEKRTPRWSGE